MDSSRGSSVNEKAHERAPESRKTESRKIAPGNAGPGNAGPGDSGPGTDSELAPDVSFSEEVATHDTLKAIAEELRPRARARIDTQNYGDRLSNAPGAKSPISVRNLDRAPKLELTEASLGRETMAAIQDELEPHRAAPEISVGEEPAGHETMVAIEQELGKPTFFDADQYEIHEMATFVVRGDAGALSSPEARRELVERRLLKRLPVRSMNEVEHIDVAPWTTRGTMIVRVWCRV